MLTSNAALWHLQVHALCHALIGLSSRPAFPFSIHFSFSRELER